MAWFPLGMGAAGPRSDAQVQGGCSEQTENAFKQVGWVPEQATQVVQKQQTSLPWTWRHSGEFTHKGAGVCVCIFADSRGMEAAVTQIFPSLRRKSPTSLPGDVRRNAFLPSNLTTPAEVLSRSLLTEGVTEAEVTRQRGRQSPEPGSWPGAHPLMQTGAFI
ncbi:hypothetical protein KIL84_021007 [Mauremys mutica]|uniref:Uncharacterized protein n=1 Tax=Mauremys mutica TaxID=74926 RepID=A0A9D3XBD9_9SAUR|nr:hypothetical protein KIL84_021007 [Mauremys mutica]